MTMTTRAPIPGKRERASVLVYPDRVNAAGICVMCFERCGNCPECVERFARLRWVICPLCQGTGWNAEQQACGCWDGCHEVCDQELRDAELWQWRPEFRA